MNILVTRNGLIKITDFGIPETLYTNWSDGTEVNRRLFFMSPEQMVDPGRVDPRTDAYSLGMTLYEMLSGKTPFFGATTKTPIAVYDFMVNGELPAPTHFNPGISDALSNFVMKAINKDKSQRFANANEMLRELERLENSGAITSQEKAESVSPIIEKPELEKSAAVETNKSESKAVHLPVTKIADALNKSYNKWKYALGVAAVAVGIVGTIFGISFLGNNKVPEKMILTEGGTFVMGNDDREFGNGSPVAKLNFKI